jgi:hypothetical protein
MKQVIGAKPDIPLIPGDSQRMVKGLAIGPSYNQQKNLKMPDQLASPSMT